MALSKRIRAFSGVVLFLSALPVAYLIGETRGARHAVGNTTQTSATNFEPIERLEQSPGNLNQPPAKPSGKCGKWNVLPAPAGSVSTTDPVAQIEADMQAMQQRMDAVFGNMQTGFPTGIGNGFGLQDLGVEEKDGCYVFHFHAPGLDKGSLKVNVDDDSLSVSGEYAQNLGQAKTSSSFSRISTLPGPVDANSLKTDYKDGTLTVTLKKQPSAGTRSLAAPLGGSILN